MHRFESTFEAMLAVDLGEQDTASWVRSEDRNADAPRPSDTKTNRIGHAIDPFWL